MKVRSSLKSAKVRDKDNILVKRRGRVYVINKKILYKPLFIIRGL